MPSSEVWTYQDAVEHVLDVFDAERAGRPLRIARRSCVEALRELSVAHRWSYYDAQTQVRTSAAYSTGTIAYDHTGGDSEYIVSLSGGTFPSTDTRHYRIIINDIHYPVNSYIDATHLTLSPDDNPGADISAGTGYTLYRNSYPLPIGFIELGELFDVTNNTIIPIVTTDQHHRDSLFWYDTPDTPWQACIRNDREYLNSLSIIFGPPPLQSTVYSFTYHRSPRQLITEKYATGTVSVAAASTVCTISGGSFTQDYIGSIIRFGTGAAEPTNIFGGLGDTDNPCSYQRTIVGVATNGLSCVLDTAPSTAISSVMFTVSDPIDIEHGAMLTAYQRLAEAAYTRLTKRDQKDRREREDLALQAVRLAKERDQRAPTANLSLRFDRFSDVNITTDTDIP